MPKSLMRTRTELTSVPFYVTHLTNITHTRTGGDHPRVQHTLSRIYAQLPCMFTFQAPPTDGRYTYCYQILQTIDYSRQSVQHSIVSMLYLAVKKLRN